MRANRNLRREVDQLSWNQVQEALCFSEEYIAAYVLSRGELKKADFNTAPSHVALKIKTWWLSGEIEDYDCPS